MPGGYSVEIGGGPLAGPTTDPDGWHVYTSGTLETPLLFVADVTADRAGGYVDGRRSSTVGDATVILVLRAWPDDPDWRARVGDLFVRALTVLGDEIGAPWPFAGELTVEETLVRASGGFAGDLRPRRGAGPGRPHGELPASSSTRRRTAGSTGGSSRIAGSQRRSRPTTPSEPRPSSSWRSTRRSSRRCRPRRRIPLNAWRAARAPPPPRRTTYGFAASLALAREIAALVGDDVLRETWSAAAAGVPAYQPGPAGRGRRAGAPETGAAPPDWRALLDLLEDRVDPGAGAALERLWRRWVIRPDDAALLDARADARDGLRGGRRRGGSLELPRSIRDAMRAWQYETALRLMDDAGGVLRQRELVVGDRRRGRPHPARCAPSAPSRATTASLPLPPRPLPSSRSSGGSRTSPRSASPTPASSTASGSSGQTRTAAWMPRALRSRPAIWTARSSPPPTRKPPGRPCRRWPAGRIVSGVLLAVARAAPGGPRAAAPAAAARQRALGPREAEPSGAVARAPTAAGPYGTLAADPPAPPPEGGRDGGSGWRDRGR